MKLSELELFLPRQRTGVGKPEYDVGVSEPSGKRPPR